MAKCIVCSENADPSKCYQGRHLYVSVFKQSELFKIKLTWVNNPQNRGKNYSSDNNINNSYGSKQALSSITGKSSISTLYAANLELIQFHYFFWILT